MEEKDMSRADEEQPMTSADDQMEPKSTHEAKKEGDYDEDWEDYDGMIY